MNNMKKTCIFLFVIMFFTGVFAFAADDLTKDPQFIFRTTKERLDKLENKIRALEQKISTIEKENKNIEKMIAQIAGDVALLNINVTKLEAESKK